MLAIVAAMAFVRMLAKVVRHHGGAGGGRPGRMERLAQLHRDLHAHDDAASAASEGVKA